MIIGINQDKLYSMSGQFLLHYEYETIESDKPSGDEPSC